jgi:branched-chain amino acid aminotransferase
MPPLKTVTSINGRLVRRGQDRISVFDNSLLYAEGLFETFLAIDDRIIFLKEHLQRLHKGARVIGLRIPVSSETLTRWMVMTVEAHPDRITKLRLTMTSGESARWTGVKGKPQVILSASPHQMPRRPFRLYVSEFRVDQDSLFRRIKTLSYAIHAAALNQARRMHCDDALLLNENDQIAEVTSANVFWVNKGRIHTPPLSAGCLEGITRKIVIRQARNLGYRLTEKNARLDDLVNADEVFISSSLKLVVPVARIRASRRTWEIKPGPVGERLAQRFAALVKPD